MVSELTWTGLICGINVAGEDLTRRDKDIDEAKLNGLPFSRFLLGNATCNRQMFRNRVKDIEETQNRFMPTLSLLLYTKHYKFTKMEVPLLINRDKDATKRK